jgi:DNA-binding GntR family transcriptional regulator
MKSGAAKTFEQPAETVATRKLRASELFEQLRSDILRCRLKPGSRLLFKDLGKRYGSGISQLRETLMRLVADGLVVVESHKGFRVSPVSREELLDIIRMRCDLEELAIRAAIEKGDLRWESNILARFHEVSNLPIFEPGGTLSDEWDRANNAFHEALYAACGSRILITFCNQLRERFGRYRRLWAQYGKPTADTVKDHENLVRAAVGRNADRAVLLIRKHFNRTTRSILDNWSAVDKDPPEPVEWASLPQSNSSVSPR